MIGCVARRAPSGLKARKKAVTVDKPTEAQATMPMNCSLRTRRPTSQLIAAPASGAKMIRLRRLFCITEKNACAALAPDVRKAIASDRSDLSYTLLRG